MHFIEKFDGENINGQHLRPPVLAILLEIERNFFDLVVFCWVSIKSVDISPSKILQLMIRLYIVVDDDYTSLQVTTKIPNMLPLVKPHTTVNHVCLPCQLGSKHTVQQC